jgi:cell division protein FtsI/penicillin-binding protein 2
MKNIFLILVTVVLLTSCASKSSFNSFYAEHKDECDLSISTPAFFANLFIPKDDVKEYKNLFKNVKHYKVMIFENEKASLDKQFDKFMKRKNYASIFRVNSDGDQVQLYFLESKNTIKEVVLKIKSDEDFVVLGLKTNISEDDFNKLMENSDLKLTGI